MVEVNRKECTKDGISLGSMLFDILNVFFL